MRKILMGLVVAILLCGIMTACGEESSVKKEAGEVLSAGQLNPDVKPYDPMQYQCPVCGETPLKAEHYVDLEKGRIYFDKKECRDKFEGSEEEYLEKHRQRMRQQMPGGAAGGSG